MENISAGYFNAVRLLHWRDIVNSSFIYMKRGGLSTFGSDIANTSVIFFNRLGHYSSGARKGRPYCTPLILNDLRGSFSADDAARFPPFVRIKSAEAVGAPLACAREIMSQPII